MSQVTKNTFGFHVDGEQESSNRSNDGVYKAVGDPTRTCSGRKAVIIVIIIIIIIVVVIIIIVVEWHWVIDINIPVITILRSESDGLHDTTPDDG